MADGDPGRPLDDARLIDKAERVMGYFGEARSARSLVELGLLALQDGASCKRLADAMWDALAT